MKEFEPNKTYKLKKKYRSKAKKDTTSKYRCDGSLWWKNKPSDTEFTVKEVEANKVLVTFRKICYVPLFTCHRKYYKEVKNTPKTVKEYLNQYFFPDYHSNPSNSSYSLGAVLHTSNSRLCTNAHIIRVEGDEYTILTDIGNVLVRSLQDLQNTYLHPIRMLEVINPDQPVPLYVE